MNHQVQSGYLIAIEGIDGSGKSTQAKKIAKVLSGNDVSHSLLAFPDYNGPLGSVIQRHLHMTHVSKHLLQMLFAADRLRRLDEIRQLLNQRCVVVIDRYKASSHVYGSAMGLSPDWCKGLESPLPEASLTLLLDIDPELSAARTGGTDPLECNIDLLRSCQQLYRDIAASNLAWRQIDASVSSEMVFVQIQDMLHELFTKGDSSNADK